MSAPTFQSEWAGVLRVIDVKWKLLVDEVYDAFQHAQWLMDQAEKGLVHPDA